MISFVTCLSHLSIQVQPCISSSNCSLLRVCSVRREISLDRFEGLVAPSQFGASHRESLERRSRVPTYSFPGNDPIKKQLYASEKEIYH